MARTNLVARTLEGMGNKTHVFDGSKWHVIKKFVSVSELKRMYERIDEVMYEDTKRRKFASWYVNKNVCVG